MRATFKADTCTVAVSVVNSRLSDGTMSSEVRGVVRPFLQPFEDQFHCVRFTIDRDGETDVSIALESRNIGGVTGAKMEQATAIAKQQIAHFEAMKLKMQGMAGNPELIINAMREGDYGTAGFMLTMIPKPESKHLTPEAQQALPSGSKADSVITAVVLDPSFKRALAMLGSDEDTLSDEDKAAYRFAATVHSLFFKYDREAIKEAMLAAPEEENGVATMTHQKLVEYIG